MRFSLIRTASARTRILLWACVLALVSPRLIDAQSFPSSALGDDTHASLRLLAELERPQPIEPVLATSAVFHANKGCTATPPFWLQLSSTCVPAYRTSLASHGFFSLQTSPTKRLDPLRFRLAQFESASPQSPTRPARPDRDLTTRYAVATIADAGLPRTVLLGSTVLLDATRSTSVTGQPLSFSWTFLSTPSGSAASFADPRAVQTTFTADKAGDYVIQLTVNDGVSDATTKVTISTQNSSPQANAGTAQKATVNSIVKLDGSGSTDPDGDKLTYHWSFVSVPSGSQAQFTDPSSITPMFTVDVAGDYVAQLSVSDASHTSIATVTISTNDLPPVAHAGLDQSTPVGVPVQLDGSGSLASKNGPLQFLWSFTCRPPGSSAVLLNANSSTPVFTPDVPGVYAVQLTVTDQTASSSTATVTVTTGDTRPVADAGAAQSLAHNTQVSLNGSSSFDADHDSLEYSWALIATPSGSNAVLSSSTSATPTFTADLQGNYVAQLIVSDGTWQSVPSTVLITATAGQAHIDPQVINFGAEALQETSSSKQVTVSNTGTAPLTIQSLSLTGSSAGEFSVTAPALPATVAPGASSAVNVTFSPQSSGPRTASLLIAHDTGPTTPVSLTGTGLNPPLLNYSPGNIQFGNQLKGQTTAATTVYISNYGSGPLVISNLTLAGSNPGDFAFSSDPLPITVNTSGTVQVTVTFTPTDIGSRSAFLSMTDNATGSPHLIFLSGTGINPAVTFNTNSLNFPDTAIGKSSTPLTLTVTNSGNATLTITGVTLTGDSSSDFSLLGATFPVSLKPSASVNLSVVFTPSQATQRSATLTLNSNSGNAPNSVTLSGNGTGGSTGALVPSPTSLAFGSVGTDTPKQLSVQLSNNGSSTLAVQGISLAGTNSSDFMVTSPTLPINLPATASTTINVTFTPSAPGTRSAAATVTYNATGSPLTIPLNGTGVPPTFSAAALDFGSQNLTTTSVPKNLIITNTGAGLLKITAIAITGTAAGDFSPTLPGPFPVTVQPNGGTLSIPITFTPSATGTRSATVTVTDNASGSPHAVTLSGTGTQPQPQITVAPASLSFPSTNVNSTSSPLMVTVSNPGTADLQVTGITLSGTNPGDFAFSPTTFPVKVAAQGSTTISVTFTPLASGSRSATLNVASNAGSTQTVSLSGTTPSSSSLMVSPKTYDFASVKTTASASTNINLSNQGGSNIIISSVTLSGPNASDFTTPTMAPVPLTLVGGGLSVINVTFKPAAIGPRSATLTIVSNAASSPDIVSLTGKGQGTPIFSPSTGTLDLGKQNVNTTTSPQKLTVTNKGNDDLVISSISTTGFNATEFAFTKPTLPLTIAAGSSADILVTFTPGGTGTRSASLLFADNATGSPHTVSLTGIGTMPMLTLQPDPIPAFNNVEVKPGNSSTQTVTMNNTGTGPLTITALNVSGTNAGDYSASAGTLPITIAPSGKSPLSVTFTPGDSGTRTATLSITSNSPGSPRAVTLTGSGYYSGPHLAVSPQSLSLDFGSQPLNTTTPAKAITFTNNGNADLNITQIALAGANQSDFNFSSPTLPIKISAGSSATIQVAFTASAAGARSASLVITHNAPGNPTTVSLTGTGIAPVCTVTPSSLDFGSSQLGTPSTPQSITISSTGTAPCIVSTVTLSDLQDFGLSIPGNLPINLAPGNNVQLSVTFKPTATIHYSANVTITHNAPNSPAVVSVGGTGVPPSPISLNPTPINFPQQAVNSSSAPANVSITNLLGDKSVNITAITITGANASEFSVSSPTLPIPIGPSATTNISVKFSPSNIGMRTATLSVSDSLDASPRTVSLSGTGYVDGAAITLPSTIDFGKQLVATNAALPIVIGNGGTKDLVITSIMVQGNSDFTLPNLSFPITVPANGSQSINVNFTPMVHGARSATLVFTDNSQLPVSPQMVSLAGFGTQPVISVSNLDLGSQQVSTTSSPKSLTIGNNGDGNLIITAILDSSPTVFPITAPALPITVAPGANATVSVSFAPTQEGANSATLTLTDNASGSPHVVNLTGTGTVPKFSVSPSPADFGSQLSQVISPPLPITVTNPGTAPLVINAISLTGTNASDFMLVNNSLPVTVAPGNGTATINVSFKPGSTGGRTANLVFADNAAGSPQSLTLTGTGLVAPPIITPASLPFGDQLLSTPPQSMTITATNASPTLNLIITSAALTGANAAEFGITSAALPLTVAPQSTAQFTVTFTPQSVANNKTATLTFTDNFAGNPQSMQTVALSGNGVPSPLTFSPSPVTFSTQPVGKSSSPPTTVTLINNSSKAITVSNIALSGSNPTDFSVTSGTLPFTIPAAGFVPITVTFTPGAVGARSANLVVTDNALGSPHIDALSGTGKGVPIVTVDPASRSIDFGSQSPQHVSSPMNVTISNTGTADLHINALTITPPSGEFALSPMPQLPITIAPNGKPTVLSLVFTPSTTGARSATLSIADDALDTPQTVTLNGTGAQACASFSGPLYNSTNKSVTFPDQQLSTTSPSTTVTVTNTCTADLIITSLTPGGANPGSFSVNSAPLPIDVPPSGSTNLNFTFTPGTSGALSATFSVVDNASDSPQVVNLSGKGVYPLMTLNPASLPNFGSLSLSTTSTPKTILVANTGTGPLTITGIASSGANSVDFNVSSPTLPVTLTPGGGTITVSVSFTPTDVGVRTANLVLTSNASDSPRSVPLTGTGVRVAIASPNPTSVSFPDQLVQTASTPIPVMLSNTGSDNLVVSAITITGTQASDFSIIPAISLPLTIKPGDPAVSIPVTFTPALPASQKARTANLVITSNAQNSPTTVVLNGNAFGTPIISLPSSPFSFGSVLQGTTGPATTLQVGNTGTDNLLINSYAVTGANASEFILTPVNTPVLVTPSGPPANFTLKFAPGLGVTGPRTATLTFTDNAAGSPHSVTLTGQATYRSITSNPSGTVDFGKQPINNPSIPINLVITNSGTADLTLQSYSLTGGNPSEFKLTGATFPLTIPANAPPVTMQLTFTPVAVGARSTTLAILHNAPGSPLQLTLQGTGTQPILTLLNAQQQPQSGFTFPSQVVNTTSNAITAIIKNTGDGPLTISNLMMSGTNPGDFAFTASPLPITIAPGAQTTVSITFTPTAIGTRNAIVQITDNATGSPHAINVTGTGTQSQVLLSYQPTTFNGNFASQLRNTSSSPVTIAIKNTGTADLHISSFALAGTNPDQFQLTAPATPLVVSAGQNTSVTVAFAPTAKGSASAVFQINDDATPSPQTVTLSGTGTAPIFSSVPTPQTGLAFASTIVSSTAPSQSINVTNKGDGNLLLNNITISGPNASDFTLGTLSLPMTIAPGLPGLITVNFKPSATGPRSATLTITDNADGSPHTFALSGTGVQPVFTVTPAPPQTLSFNPQYVGTSSPTQQITIGNSGDGDLIISAMAFSGPNGGDFVIANPALPITIHPNSSPYVLNVSFAPNGGTPGPRTATLTFTDNAPNPPHIVSLSGTATQSQITFNGSPTPATLDFGTHNTNTPTPMTLTVGNSGNGDLQITSAGPSACANPCDFAVTPPGSYPIVIPANGPPVTFTITFTPLANNQRTANLAFNDNTPGSPQFVPLTGVGQGPVAAVTPATIDFGTVGPGSTSVTKNAQVGNTGNAPLQVTAVALTGANPSDFVLQGVSVPFTVQPNGTPANVGVAYRPGGTNASSSATLSVTDNAPGSPHTVLLTGMTHPCLLTFPQAITVGQNLEVLATVGLSCSLRNTISVTVTSDNPSLVLLSSDSTGMTPGGNSVTVPITGGTTAAFPGFYVQALGTGSTTLTASATGMDNVSVPVTLIPAGFELSSPGGVGAPITATVGASDTPLVVTAVTLDSNQKPVTTMRVRAGLNVTVPISSSDSTVGTIMGTAVVSGGQTSSNGASFHAVAVGQTALTAQTPAGFTPLSTTNPANQVIATVNAPAITLNSVVVGNHFEVLTLGTLSAPAPQTGLAVTISSAAPGVALLSTSATAAGSSSIIVNVPGGATTIPPFYVYGMSIGNTVLQVSATGYMQAPCGVPPNPCPGAVGVVASGFLIGGSNGTGQDFTTSTASQNTQLTVTAERLDGSGNPLAPGIIQGGLTVLVKVNSSNTAAGTIQSGTVVFTCSTSGCPTSVSTAFFHPVGLGMTTLSLDSSSTPGFSNPSSLDTLNVTVTQPQIVFSLPTTNVGINLQLDGGAKLTAPAPSGGLVVHITSNNPQVVLSSDPTIGGSSFVDLTVPANNGVDGIGFPPFYAQVLPGNAGGTATLTASATGYANATVTLNITPSAFTLTSVNGLGQNFSINTGSATTSVLTISGMQLNSSMVPQQVQSVRGGLSFSVTISSSMPNVGIIAESPVPFSGGIRSQTITFTSGTQLGTTTLSVVPPPGFSTASPGGSLNATVSKT